MVKILVICKPASSDKLTSINKTSGTFGEAEITELETKMRFIKGKDIFERNETGIDLSMGTNSPLYDFYMAISSTGTLQNFGSQSG